LQKNPDSDVAFVIKAVKYKFIDLVRYKTAKKRNPGSRVRSLDDGSLLHFVGGESGVVSAEEVMDGFKQGLKKKLGRHYIKELEGNGRPDKEKVRAIIRSVIEGVYGIPVSEIPNKVNYQFFRDCGLENFLWVFYKNSAFSAVMDAFPGEVVPWNFKKKPNRFWQGRKGCIRALEAVKWFAEKHELKSEKDCRKIKYNDFEIEGLSGMLQIQFGHSPYLALKSHFPKLKPWQTRQIFKGYYDNMDKRREALSFYLMDKGFPDLKNLSSEEVYELGLRTVVTKEDIDNEGLRGLQAKYKGNVYLMFCDLLPGKILPWTLSSSKQAWKDNPKEIGAEAIRWLFDKYLQIPKNEIPDYATCDLFWRVGFSGIMTNKSIEYNSSPYNAVNSAYPGRFLREDFKRSKRDNLPKLNVKNLKKSRK